MTITDEIPLTISELTERVQKIAEKMISERSRKVEFGEKKKLPENYLSLLFQKEEINDLLTFDIHSSVEKIGEYEIIFHYGGEPVLYSGIEKRFEVSIRKNKKEIEIENIEVKGPSDWKISKLEYKNGKYVFTVFCENMKKTSKIDIVFNLEGGKTVSFTLLSPEEVKIIPASTFAPKDEKKGKENA